MNRSSPRELETLVRFVLAKKKYSQIDRGLIAAIVNQELSKGRKDKETRKAILGKLHQIGCVYFEQQPAYKKWETALSNLPDDLQAQVTRDFCIRLMQQHHSTHERLYILQDFFQQTLAPIQPIPSILDLACGLNPLALPWMPIKRNVQYYGCDIFNDMTQFLQQFATHFHLAGEFTTCNIFDSSFSTRVKVAFLLKPLPCLEQIQKGFAPALLRKIPAEFILISYPISSLSGRSKGMKETYSMQFKSLIETLGWTYQSFSFSSEIAFLVEKR